MGTMLVKIKLMPESLEVNLEEIRDKTKEILENNKGKNIEFEMQEIAFGLKALITSFALPEEQGLEELENSLNKIENVKSTQIVDMRRAFG